MYGISPMQAPVTLVGTTETPVVTSDQIQDFGATVCLHGVMNVTAGTGTTQMQIRVRRGTDATGPLIGMPDGNGHQYRQHSLSAASVKQLAFCECDEDPVPYEQYTLTVQQVGATGNGTVNAACICTDVVGG